MWLGHLALLLAHQSLLSAGAVGPVKNVSQAEKEAHQMKMEEDAHKLLADLKNRNETSTDENDMLKRIMDRLMWKRELRGKNNIKKL